MALTTDDILVRVTVDQTGAIKGFKDLDGNLMAIAKAGDTAGKSASDGLEQLDAATLGVIQSTRALATAIEYEGKTAEEASKLQAQSRLDELGYIEKLLQMNGQLTAGAKAELDVAKNMIQRALDIKTANEAAAVAAKQHAAAQAQVAAEAKKMAEATAIAQRLKDETKAINLETERLGKTTQQLAEIEKREALARVQQLENELMQEGKLTQGIAAQMDAQRKAIAARATAKVSMADADAMKATAAATKTASSELLTWAGVVTLANQGVELAVKAVTFLKDTLYAAVAAFRSSQDDITRFASTLKILGEHDIAGTVDKFKAFAEEMARTTTVTKEQVLQLSALGKQMGLTDDRTEELVKTAVDLAAAYNEDVGTAFEQLSQSLKGNARGLGLLRPEIAGAAKDWLQAGGAVTYFADLLHGRGTEELNTFQGQLKQNAKLFEEFKKSVGEGIMVGLGIDPEAPSQIAKLADYLDDVKVATETVTSTMKGFAVVIYDVVKIGITMFGGLKDIIVDDFKIAFEGISNFAKGAASALEKLRNGEFKAAAASLANGFHVSTKELQTDVLKQGDTIIATFKDITKQFDRTAIAAGLATDATKKFSEETRKAPAKPPKAADENALKEAAKLYDELIKKTIQLGQEAAKAGANEYDLIRQKANAETRDLDVLVSKLRTLGPIKKEMQDQITLAREQIKLGVQSGIRELVEKKVLDVKQQNFDLDLKMLELTGDQAKAADMVARAELDKLSTSIKASEAQGAVTAELTKQLKAEATRVQLVAQRAKFEKEMAELNPAAQAVGRGLADAIPVINDILKNAGAVFGITVGDMAQGTILKIAAAGAKVFDQAVDVLDAAFQAGSAVFNPDVINGLADALDGVSKLPAALVDAFLKLGTVIDAVVKDLPAAVKAMIDQIPSLVQTILNALPALIDTLAKAFDQIIQALPGVFDRIFQKLPEIVDHLAAAMPKIIKDLFAAAGDIIADLLKSLPGILTELLNHLPDIIEAIVEGLLNSVGKIASAIIGIFLDPKFYEQVATQFLLLVPRLAIGFVVGVVKGLQEALGSIFNGLKIKIPGGDIADKLQDGLKKVASTASGVTEQVFKVIDIGAANKAKAVGDDIRAAAQSATDEMRTVFQGLWAALKSLWQWVWDHIMKPIIDGLREVWQWIYDKILSPVISAIQAVWQWVDDHVIGPAVSALKDVWQWVYDHVISPIATFVKDAFQGIYDKILSPLITAFNAMFEAAWAAAKAVFQFIVGLLELEWTALKAAFKVVGALLETEWAAVKAVFQTVVNLLRAEWTVMQAVFKGVISLFTDAWDALKLIGKGIVDLFTGNWADLKNVGKGLADVFGKVVDTIKSVVNTATSAFGAAFKPLIDFFKNDLAGFIKTAFTFVWSIFDGLKKISIPAFDAISSAIGKLFNTPGWLADLEKAASALTGGGGGGSGELGKLTGGKLAAGGVVKAAYAAAGLYVAVPRGTDRIPVMQREGEGTLTPEAVARIGGKNTIDALNAGGLLGGRQAPPSPPPNVTNTYSISVTVQGANVNADDLAQKIMKKIKDDSYAGRQIMSTRGLRSS